MAAKTPSSCELQKASKKKRGESTQTWVVTGSDQGAKRAIEKKSRGGSKEGAKKISYIKKGGKKGVTRERKEGCLIGVAPKT